MKLFDKHFDRNILNTFTQTGIVQTNIIKMLGKHFKNVIFNNKKSYCLPQIFDLTKQK